MTLRDGSLSAEHQSRAVGVWKYALGCVGAETGPGAGSHETGTVHYGTLLDVLRCLGFGTYEQRNRTGVEILRDASARLARLEEAFAGFQGLQHRPGCELLLSQAGASGAWMLRYSPMEFPDGMILSWVTTRGPTPTTGLPEPLKF